MLVTAVDFWEVAQTAHGRLVGNGRQLDVVLVGKLPSSLLYLEEFV